VETGGRSNSQVEEWRFCDVCSHMGRDAQAQGQVTCPNCGSRSTQRMAMIHTAPGGGEHAPYTIREVDGGYAVFNEKGERKNKDPKTHDEARQFQKALYMNVPGASESAKESAVDTSDWPKCEVCGEGVSPIERAMDDNPIHTKKCLTEKLKKSFGSSPQFFDPHLGNAADGMGAAMPSQPGMMPNPTDTPDLNAPVPDPLQPASQPRRTRSCPTAVQPLRLRPHRAPGAGRTSIGPTPWRRACHQQPMRAGGAQRQHADPACRPIHPGHRHQRHS
jgi:hypothetical protein